MIRSGDNRKTQLLSQLDQTIFFSVDLRGAYMVSLYKRKGDECECSNSRGVSLLSVVGKLYGRMLIKRVRAGTEFGKGEKQCVLGIVEAWIKCSL